MGIVRKAASWLMPNHTNKIETLKDAVSRNDAEAIFRAALAAGDAGASAAVPLFLRLLRTHDSIRVKNGAAIALSQLRIDAAVPHLILIIEDPKYRDQRGTLVYALHNLNWYRKYSHTIVRLLTDENY